MRVRTFATILMTSALSACGAGPKSAYLSTPGGGSKYAEGTLPGMRLTPATCQGVAEMRPEYTVLDESSLMRFLKARGYELGRTRARSDLVYVDVLNAGGDAPVRLRVAILPSAQQAGRDLHEAILDHGPGSWGVHRSNLAVLAPIGNPDQVAAFAGKSQLACWGVLTMAGRDDTFVITGGYTEL
jgi:hypothetical protein